MATAARANIEALLRERKLDTTLTTSRPACPAEAERRRDLRTIGPSDLRTVNDQFVVATGIAALDERLGGGLARGQMSEIVGPRSSGRTSVLLSAIAGATARGELAALVDTFDTFDPGSARACGVDLSRLLWVRGRTPDAAVRQAHGALTPRRCSGSLSEVEGSLSKGGLRTPDHGEAITHALKAANLILQAGGFGLVALDLADAPRAVIGRLPFTTWFRLQRPIEGSSTACVLLAEAPTTRSAGGVTIALRRRDDAEQSAAKTWRSYFTGFEVDVDIRRARGIAESCRFSCAAPF